MRRGKASRSLWLLLALGPAGAGAQALPSRTPASGVDVGITYTAQRSLRAATDQNFWLQGGAAEAGLALWHGLGPAAATSGGASSSIGSSGVPLSLITFVAGPRLRLHQRAAWSPYAEALFGVAHGFNSTFPASNALVPSATSFALQAGGGLDVRLRRHVSLRALRVMYVRSQLPNATNNVQNTLSVASGVAFSFTAGMK